MVKQWSGNGQTMVGQWSDDGQAIVRQLHFLELALYFPLLDLHFL
jgi:hypothetical protein